MERRGKPTVPAPNHRYPPVELLRGVKVINGKYVAGDMTPTPTIDGIPDPRGILEALGERIVYDEQYMNSLDLAYFNNHHGAGERNDYYRFGPGSLEVAYREDPALRIDMFIPFHNVDHLTKEKAPLAKTDVMHSRGRELKTVKRLFNIVDALVWLEGMHGGGVQQHRTAVDYIERNGYKSPIPFQQRRSFLITTGKIDENHRFRLPTQTMFLDELSRVAEPEWGILPNPEMLAGLELDEAWGILAKIATAQAALSVEESTAIIIEASRTATGYDLAA